MGHERTALAAGVADVYRGGTSGGTIVPSPLGNAMKSILLTAACVVVLPAAAQGAAPAADRAEIIVTATRRAAALSDVPVAVSAVGAEAMRNSGATDIRALNQLVPSLLVSSTSTEANGAARIRGIGTVGDNPGLESSVAVFVDGVYRSRTGLGLNELGDIERIEVLMGPQGTLFGRNATAGLINIVTTKPSFTTGGNAEASYGNYGYYRLGGGLTGALLPGVLAARIDGVYVKRDGFLKDITGNDGRDNDRDRYLVRGQLLFTPTPDVSLRVIGDYTRRDEKCCAAVYISTRETFDPTPNPTAGVNADHAVAVGAATRIVDILHSLGGVVPDDPYRRRTTVTPGRTYANTTTDWGGSGQLDWDLGAARLTAITAYRRYKIGTVGDVDYSNVDISYRPSDGNAYRRFKTFTQEVRLLGTLFGDRLDWLVGGFYTREKVQIVDNVRFGTQYGAFASCRVVAGVSPAAGLRDPAAPGCLSPAGRDTLASVFGANAPLLLAGLDRLGTLNDLGSNRDVFNQDSENYAFFTHDIVKLTDRLSVTAGLRWTHERKDFDASFDNDNVVCPVQQAALGPLLANPGLAAVAGGIVALSCVGNSSSDLNALDLRSGLRESEFTGTAVVAWQPVDAVLAYVSYARGYKAGGFNLDRTPLGGPAGVFSPRSDADAAGLRFAAEKVDSYEAGLKLDVPGFTLNLAAFREAFRSFQLNTFNGSVFIVQNVNSCGTDLAGGDTDSSRATGACTGRIKPGVVAQGVEAEAAVHPAPDLAVAIGYTYADARYRRNLVGSGGGVPLDPQLFLLPGSQLSNAPKNVVTASLGFTPDLRHGLSALFYVDARLTSAYNTGSDLFPEKAQEGFTTVNARIGLRGRDRRWSLELWGQNIFDKNYQQVAFNTSYQGAGSAAQVAAFGGLGTQLFSTFPAEPRTYGATVRSRF